jgi:N-acyl-D-aspartate/D-glutamate deacylase
MPDCDMLITGGLIADGNGGEPFAGDVAISGDRIVHVGPGYSGTAAEVIDAEGLLVTPGFVDIHTHYDGQATWSEELSPSSSHGVTTAVAGNCGVGFAPCRPADREALIEVMEGVEDIPGVVMADGLPWDWETFPEYLDALDRRAHDIDVAAFLPHSPLRVYAMGERGIRREGAGENDLARMREIAREALEAGALGFASSRLMIHKTLAGAQIPSFDADMAEIAAICEALGEAGTGVLQIVLNVPFSGWGEELEPVIAIAEKTGRPMTFTLGLPNQQNRNWDPALELCDAARARGVEVWPQLLPRPVGMVAGWDLSTNPFCLCPSYLEIANLPLAEKLGHLRDPAFRAQLIAEEPEAGHPLAMMTRDWDWIFPLNDPPSYEPRSETSLGAMALATGRTPQEIAYDQLMNEGVGDGMLYIALGNLHAGKLDEVHDLMQRGDIVLGLGDGGAHYSAICDASYTTWMLTHWTRDREAERLALGHAIHHLAARPAQAAGLLDRGRLAPGYKADLNVIDMERLALHKPVIRHDLPGGGRRLDQGATGYVATVCGGEVIRRNDRPTGARPGKLVRGAQAAPKAV